MYVDEDGLRQLAAMACLITCSDYKKAVRKGNKKMMKECHEFFEGDIFQFFVNYKMSAEEIEKILIEGPSNFSIAYLRKNFKNTKHQ